MTDLVTLLVRAGKGGDGRVSFHREKYVLKGGPDGGRGGDGGSITLRASNALATLKHFAGVKEFSAEDGQVGGRRKQFGAKGQDLVLEVPVGTTIWVLAENSTARKRRRKWGLEKLAPRDSFRRSMYELQKEGQGIPAQQEPEWLEYYSRDWLQNPQQVTGREFRVLKEKAATQALQVESGSPADSLGTRGGGTEAGNTGGSPAAPIELYTLSKPGEEVILCQGGLGGRGNESFKSGARTTPLVAEYGTYGEQRLVVLEQRLLADVGLVGFPSVGKSTLLSVLTKARPKIAAYPFTTLEPNLGIMTAAGAPKQTGGVATGVHELVLADIPGLVEGANEGKGLGFDFLRHVENTSVVLFVVALDEASVYDDSTTPLEKAESLWQQYTILKKELALHSPELAEKVQVVSCSKADLYSEELRDAVKRVFARKDIHPVFFSSATSAGLEELRSALFAASERFQEQKQASEQKVAA